MNKYLLIFLLLNSLVYSQRKLQFVIKEFHKIENFGNSNILDSNIKIFRLGIDSLSNFECKKNFKLLSSDNNESVFSTYKISSYKNYAFYCFHNTNSINLQIDLCISNSISKYLIYNTESNNLFYFQTAEAGTVCKKNNSELEFTPNFSSDIKKIYKINNWFLPLSSIEYMFVENSNFKYKISTYKTENKKITKTSKIIILPYNNLESIPLKKIENLLNQNMKDTFIDDCKDTLCNSVISKYLPLP
ncbi:hypothetical protein SAMN05444363_1329 [Flavobacterium terrae]|uniref:Uncharacterized protein n=1 Tax=Flavobacterium terrae TaxID=415425 RepID=A0A1M6DAC9_9FLAO|nr:hypothetical protein SAMN05444363_1329 [Flavobacterium terrae]